MDIVSAVNLIHIITGVFWAGGVIMMAWFIAPAAGASGEGGQAFMKELTQETRMVLFLSVSSFLAIVSGIYMYWVFSGGLDRDWLSSGKGVALTIGGIAAVGAFLTGQLISGSAARRIARLAGEIQKGEGSPGEEQLNEIKGLQGRMARGANWTAILIVVALVGMALGRSLY